MTSLFFAQISLLPITLLALYKNLTKTKKSSQNGNFVAVFFFIAGIFSHQYCFIPESFVILATIVFCTKNFFLPPYSKKYKTFLRGIFFYGLFFFSGSLLLSLQINEYKKKQFFITSALKNERGKKATFSALVVDKKIQVSPSMNEKNFFKTTITLKPLVPEGITFLGGKKFFSKKILWYTTPPQNVSPGDLIQLYNVKLHTPTETKIHLRSSKGATFREGITSFDRYLIKENVVATIFSKNIIPHDQHNPLNKKIRQYKPTYKIIKKDYAKIRSWSYKKKMQFFSSIKSKMPKKTFAYFSSIFLGNKKNRYIEEVRHIFSYWGISHHLARSGLHIALFVLIFSTFFSVLPFFIKHFLLILLSIIYTLLSWTSISFVRAISIFFLYEFGQIFNKQTNFLYHLTVVTFVVLTLNPSQLFFLDFQLSFGITTALACLCEKQKAQSLAPSKGSSVT